MRSRIGGAGRRLVALATLVGLLLPSLALGHPVIETDRDCGSVVLGRHLTTELETDSAPVAAEHCAYCHFLRAIAGASPSTAGNIAPDVSPSPHGLTTDDRWHQTEHLGLHPSRAPPSVTSSLSVL